MSRRLALEPEAEGIGAWSVGLCEDEAVAPKIVPACAREDEGTMAGPRTYPLGRCSLASAVLLQNAVLA